MPDVYPGTECGAWDPGDGMPCLDQPTVRNVAVEFGRIRMVGDYLAIHEAGLLPGRVYTDTNLGSHQSRTHLQGVLRMGPPNDEFVLFTGGDPEARSSHLLVGRMGSRRKDGPWSTNLRFDRMPPDDDRLVRLYRLHGKYWHAGGMSLLGDLLALPLEDDSDGTSAVAFLDATDPLDIRLMSAPCFIERPPDVGKAGAVALTCLPNHHYLCGVWSDSDQHPRRIDFYLSKSEDLSLGFDPAFVSWTHERLLPVGCAPAAYQNINFVTQTDGELFVIGTENSSPASPYADGEDRLDLMHVEFPHDTTHALRPALSMPTITRVATRSVTGERGYSNLDAAGGIYIDRDWSAANGHAEGRLTLYGAYHWKLAKTLHFIEYGSEVPITAPFVTEIEDGWIDLYDDPNFHGRRLTIFGTQDASIPDYGDINVQARGFGDRVSSVRYQLPAGEVYRLYRDSGFRPKDTRKSIALVGDGAVHEIPDLNALGGFSDQVSSSRYD